jgi:DNA-binding LytR/AlgR family response regulator
MIQNRALKQNLKEANELNKRLVEQLHNETPLTQTKRNAIVLSGNTKETITLTPEDILYMEVAGNYLKITYLFNAEVKQRQLRATIAQVEQDLQPYPYLVRCHRAFMVNVLYITNVEGYSRGYRLSFRYTNDTIPVSRSYAKMVRDKLNADYA